MNKEEQSIKNFPTVLVVFGGTGELVRQRLLPGLFHLYQRETLPKMFRLVGFSRDNLTLGEYRSWLRKNLPQSEPKKVKKKFLDHASYQSGLFENLKAYRSLARRLGTIDGEFRLCSNKLFYLAAPPPHYEAIFKNLARSGLTKPCSEKEGWTRVLVEKPFGQDLKRARKLDRLLGELFQDIQVYRLDHYLAKETLLNLLAFRFSNAVFERVWNKEFIEKIEIRLLEKKGLAKRAAFYDTLGALRDVGQNHLLQMLALVTMEPPPNFEPTAIARQKTEILEALPRLNKRAVAGQTSRGQYKGYLKIPGVRRGSRTETYFRIKTSLHHQRWQGVPIILESGKKMDRDLVEIKMTFRHPRVCLFCDPYQREQHKNTLTFKVRPREGIIFCFFAKEPGEGMSLERKELHFLYQEAFKKERRLPEYERLLIDAFLGDQTLFASTKEILASWRFIDPILKGWQENVSPLKLYQSGTSGPK